MPAVETLQETRNADGSWHGPGTFPEETTIAARYERLLAHIERSAAAGEDD